MPAFRVPDTTILEFLEKLKYDVKDWRFQQVHLLPRSQHWVSSDVRRDCLLNGHLMIWCLT